MKPTNAIIVTTDGDRTRVMANTTIAIRKRKTSAERSAAETLSWRRAEGAIRLIAAGCGRR
jgi:streptomycin 6-kinase